MKITWSWGRGWSGTTLILVHWWFRRISVKFIFIKSSKIYVAAAVNEAWAYSFTDLVFPSVFTFLSPLALVVELELSDLVWVPVFLVSMDIFSRSFSFTYSCTFSWPRSVRLISPTLKYKIKIKFMIKGIKNYKLFKKDLKIMIF